MGDGGNRHFQRGLTNAPLWYTNSADLMRGAEALWALMEPLTQATTEDHLSGRVEIELYRFQPPALLLAGLAVETRFKALAVAKRFGRQDGGHDESAPTEIPAEWKTAGWMKHDLSRLALLAGVDWAAGYKDLLSRLSEMVVWRAKYPIPKEPQAVQGGVLDLTEMGRVKELMARLDQDYYAALNRSEQARKT